MTTKLTTSAFATGENLVSLYELDCWQCRIRVSHWHTLSDMRRAHMAFASNTASHCGEVETVEGGCVVKETKLLENTAPSLEFGLH